MAVTLDATSGSQNTTGTTLTVSHTCSGDNRILIVGAATSGIPTSITYAGVSMTKLGEHTEGGQNTSLWALAAPATGANDIVMTVPFADNKILMACSFNGSNGTTGTYASAGGTSTTPSVTVSGAVGDMIIDCVMHAGDNPQATIAPDASQTERQDIDTGTSWGGAMSTEDGAASVSMDWTLSKSLQWSISGVAVKAGTQGGGGASLPTLGLLGVGM